MPLDYLRKIERETFPLTVTDEKEIQCVAVLKAAALIEATIPPPSKDKDTFGEQGPALVIRITPMGRAELLRRT